MGCHIWDYIIEGGGIFLAGIFPLIGLDEASEHAGRLRWQEIKDSLQPIARRKEKVGQANSSQQAKTRSPMGYRDLSSANTHTNPEGGSSLSTP